MQKDFDYDNLLTLKPAYIVSNFIPIRGIHSISSIDFLTSNKCEKIDEKCTVRGEGSILYVNQWREERKGEAREKMRDQMTFFIVIRWDLERRGGKQKI
jgi:hypothetical protein